MLVSIQNTGHDAPQCPSKQSYSNRSASSCMASQCIPSSLFPDNILWRREISRADLRCGSSSLHFGLCTSVHVGFRAQIRPKASQNNDSCSTMRWYHDISCVSTTVQCLAKITSQQICADGGGVLAPSSFSLSSFWASWVQDCAIMSSKGQIASPFAHIQRAGHFLPSGT